MKRGLVLPLPVEKTAIVKPPEMADRCLTYATHLDFKHYTGTDPNSIVIKNSQFGDQDPHAKKSKTTGFELQQALQWKYIDIFILSSFNYTSSTQINLQDKKHSKTQIARAQNKS